MNRFGAATGIEAAKSHGYGRIADIDHLEARVSIRDIGKATNHLHVRGPAAGVEAAKSHGYGRIADIDHLEARVSIRDISEIADHLNSYSATDGVEAAKSHGYGRIADIDDCDSGHSEGRIRAGSLNKDSTGFSTTVARPLAQPLCRVGG